jgi:hypothetical protein
MSYIDIPSLIKSVTQAVFTLYRFVTQIGDTSYIQGRLYLSLMEFLASETIGPVVLKVGSLFLVGKTAFICKLDGKCPLGRP